MRKEAKDCGIPTVFHPHGDLSSPANLPLVDEIAATGVEGFQFAERNDPLVLKERFSDRMCLLGGIDAFSTLLLGPVERIEQESLSFLRTFEPCKGYVFMCSCSLHRGMALGQRGRFDAVPAFLLDRMGQRSCPSVHSRLPYLCWAMISARTISSRVRSPAYHCLFRMNAFTRAAIRIFPRELLQLPQ